jgi:hypothetical protein
MKWYSLFAWVFQRGLFGGIVLGGLFGTFYLPIIGTLFGLCYGALLGLIVGIVDGLALSLLTRILFATIQDLRIYRLISVIVSVLCTVVTTQVTLDSLVAGSAFMVVQPTVIAAFASLYFAWRFPAYAQTQFALRNPPANVLS